MTTPSGRWPRDLLSGLTCGLISIVFCLTYSALIFSGPLSPWLAYGVASTFITAAVAATVFATRSSLPFAIAGPDNATSAVTASLAAAFSERLLATGYQGPLLGPVLIVIGLGGVLAGVLLCALGTASAGRAIRFVPYPVIGGFLGATGWLVSEGAVRVTAGAAIDAASLTSLFASPAGYALTASAAIAAAIFLARRRWPESTLVLPGVLLSSTGVFYAALAVQGTSIERAMSDGWTFAPQGPVSPILPTFDALVTFPWQELPAVTGELVAIMFVTAIGMLMNTTGLEIASQRDADLDRDLTTLGAANMASAALGGYSCCVSLSRSTINFISGSTSRISALITAAISGGMLFIDPVFLSYIPKSIVGGVLLYVGVDLLQHWLIESRRRLSLADYVSLLLIAAIIVKFGFIAGVVLGVIIGCATFAASASRVRAIRFAFDASEFRSSLDRGPNEVALLSKYAHELQGMMLQSYLFFGSTSQLRQHVKRVLNRHEQCRFLLFDFRLVTGIDSSATQSFLQMKQSADKAGARIVLVGLSPNLRATFAASGFIASEMHEEPDLDRALEWCENAIISARSDVKTSQNRLEDWLIEALGGQHNAAILASHCRRIEVRAGEVIARQGDPSQSMYFVVDGRVGIVVESQGSGGTRVRSLGRQTTVGEMGLITGQPRSATMLAERDAVLYELTAAAYETIKRQEPQLGQILLSYIVTVMAERLGFASRAIGVMKR